MQGDFDGDGILDAIVSTTASGTQYWRGGKKSECGFLCFEAPSLTYIRTLDASATPSNSSVLVGNFSGDGCDDVLISRSSGITQWEGGEPSALLAPKAYVIPVSWVPPFGFAPVLAVGNFTGAFARLDTVPEYAQTTNYGSFPNRSKLYDYDELFVRFASCWAAQDLLPRARWERIHSDQRKPDRSRGLYTGIALQAWSANFIGDYHDDLLVRTERTRDCGFSADRYQAHLTSRIPTLSRRLEPDEREP